MSSKTLKIKQFIQTRLSQLDLEYSTEEDIMKRLNLSTMRTSFANILSVYLGEDQQLGASYLQHAQTYLQAQCYEQALHNVELAKKHIEANNGLYEEILLLNLTCYLKLNKIEEAQELLKQSTPKEKPLQFAKIKTDIYEQLGNEQETFEAMSELEAIIRKQFGEKSKEMGMALIEKGRKKATFKIYPQALDSMQRGMNLLIEVRCKDHLQISKIYTQMASYHRHLSNLDNEYSSLICACSMLRQCAQNEPQMLQLMHKIASNLFQREDYEACLRELLQIQQIEKHIYGEASATVGQTLKSIGECLNKMGRKGEAKKYELEMSRISACNEKKGMSREKPLRYHTVKN